MEIKKRVKPFGMGKALFTIKMEELPPDIRDGLINLFSSRSDKAITDDTNTILICGDVLPIDENS